MMETRGKIIESDSHQIPKLRKKFKLARLRKKKNVDSRNLQERMINFQQK